MNWTAWSRVYFQVFSSPRENSTSFLFPQIHKEFRCCRTVPGIVIIAERENFQDFGVAHRRFENLDPIFQVASAVDDGLVPRRCLLLNLFAVSKPANISEVRRNQVKLFLNLPG